METAIATRPLEAFTAVRPVLCSIAYAMLGTAMEAEDMVQEAILGTRIQTIYIIVDPDKLRGLPQAGG